MARLRQRERNKHYLLTEYAKLYGPKIFIETGTYRGDTVKAMLKTSLFEQIHTVDIYEDRVENAQQRFASFRFIHCWHGDSAVVLPDVLAQIKEPALLWLDAHHSGKQIARVKGLIETPIKAELQAVLQHPHDHVILIDDASYYKKYGKKIAEYPTTSDLRDMVTQYRPDWEFVEMEDIIRIHRHGFDCKTSRDKGPLC